MAKLLVWYILFLILLCKSSSAEYLPIPNLPNTNNVYEELGDINIGGIFPLHQAGAGKEYCGELRELGVLQRAETMAYFIRQINNDSSLLPGIKLGYVILDDCYKETTALAQGLQFVQKVDSQNDLTAQSSLAVNSSVSSSIQPKDVVAVIGAESSTNSKQLAELFGLFEIPQVSYMSTSPTLSDKVAYPYFSRIVPSDVYQISAMLNLLERFEWRYVSFIYTLNNYGLQAYLILLNRLKSTDNNICMAVEIALSEKPTNKDYEEVLDRLIRGSENAQAHAVILFMPQVNAQKLLKTAQDKDYVGKFTWIGSDAWGRNVQDFHGIETVSEGAITVKINSTSDSEFDQYFSKLNPRNSKNPFFNEFWNHLFNCNSSRICNENGTIADSKDYESETTVSLVKLAVYLVANSLHELMLVCRNEKANASDCVGKKAREYVTGKQLQSKIRGTKGCLNGTCIDVTITGDARSSYSIMNYQKKRGSKYVLKPIGRYDGEKLTLVPLKEIHWNTYINKSTLSPSGIPTSVCSLPCQTGQKQVRSLSFWHSKCCWTCENCQSNEITITKIVDSFPTTLCQECPTDNTHELLLFSTPANFTTQCEPIVPENLGFSSSLGMTIIILDCACLCITVILLCLYIKNRNEKLIMATSRELSYVIWAGIIFSYVSLIFFFFPLHKDCNSPQDCAPKPYTSWCYIQFITFNMSFTIINAPILTRANRIHRIFRNGKRSAKRPKFIETGYQLMFILILIAVQAMIILICSVYSATTTNPEQATIQIINYLDETDTGKSYVACEMPYKLLLAPIAYNLLIALACAFHAFKTRKLPDNYNESKFIGIAVYTTIILWIAFIPSYLTITSKFYKGLPLTIGMLINATITTAVLFVPRLYALHWVEKIKIHVRTHSLSVTSSTSGNLTEKRLDRLNSSYSSVTTSTNVTPSAVTFDLTEEIQGDLSIPDSIIESPHHTAYLSPRGYVTSVSMYDNKRRGSSSTHSVSSTCIEEVSA